MKQLQKVLKHIGIANIKYQKNLLPNIEGGRRFHLSYAQLNLR